MRWVFAILALFFISFAFNSQSRELTFKERATLLPVAKTLRVKDHMLKHIIPSELGWSDYFSFQVLKNGCAPLASLQSKIETSPDELADQSQELLKSYGLCAEAVLGLTDMYLRVSDHAQEPEDF